MSCPIPVFDHMRRQQHMTKCDTVCVKLAPWNLPTTQTRYMIGFALSVKLTRTINNSAGFLLFPHCTLLHILLIKFVFNDYECKY